MATFKTVPKTKLSHDQFWDLMLSTYSKYDFWPVDSPFKSPEHRKKAWRDNREKIISSWAESARPKTMPGGWWDYESKERLRVIGRMPFTDVNGKPETRICYHTGRELIDFPVYESEEVALSRMGII